MHLSNHEAEFFNRLKNVNLSARDRAEIRMRSPALANAIEEYQHKNIPRSSGIADIRNILPQLHPHQIQAERQVEALHRMGYMMDLEGLKANNPWTAHNLSAMLIIEQLRPQWATVLKTLANQRKQSISPNCPPSEDDQPQPDAESHAI